MSNFIVTDNLTPDIKGTSLALGFFDGIHRGHARVLKSALEHAKKFGTKSVVVTFKNHPTGLLYGIKEECITTPEERTRLFKRVGFDVVIMADFTKAVAEMSAHEYFSNVIMNLEPKSISIGYNHKFGAKKEGNSELLQKLTEKNGIELEVIQKVMVNSEIAVSSTAVKNLIKSGSVDAVSKLLIKPYCVRNKVLHGMRRGRQLGFPTANLEFPNGKIIPKLGVYAGKAVVEGVEYPAVANVGMRPTFNDVQDPLTEVNIIGFNKNLYDEEIEFRFLKRLRGESQFFSIEALIEQIVLDRNQAIAFLKK